MSGPTIAAKSFLLGLEGNFMCHPVGYIVLKNVMELERLVYTERSWVVINKKLMIFNVILKSLCCLKIYYEQIYNADESGLF